jgi:hypothetical protein
MAESIRGSCMCGRVAFELVPPTLFNAHCHCTMCRRAHGAAYVTWTAVPYEHFQVTAGKDELVIYDSSEHGRRSFCRTCGSTLFCESTRHPERIDVVVANLLDPMDREPQVHAYWDDRAEWTRIGDDLPKLGEPTGDEGT